MKRAYADTPTGQVHFRELGDGVPLVCFHKTPSSSIQFIRVAPLLAAAGFRVIAVDSPGFGGSDPLPGGPTIPGFAAAALAVLDHLGVERAHVLGHHTGSLTAVELAARHAHRVESVILGGLLVMRDEAERAAYRPYLLTYAFELDSRGAFLDRYPRGPLNDWLTRDDPEQYWLESVAYMQGARTFTATYECTLVYDAIDALPAIRRPTLFLDQEQGRCHEHTQRIWPLVPGSEYVCLPGTSEGCLDAPEEFAAAALSFLRRHAGTR